MDRPGCTRQLLASSELAQIEQCSCGSVHVTIGALTLRLAASAIPSLALTLGDAARALLLHDAFVHAARPSDALS